jgi:2Fe-2S iron-sulfur cluster binding domain
MAFTIQVNGQTHTVDVDDDTPLLWVLRDVLGMTGTKFGCGIALCGACTVHIDGVATRSCITSVDSIGASAITRSARRRPAPRCRKPGWTAKCRNAATANRDRSCRPRHCSQAIRARPTPPSTMRCPATSAAAGPTCVFARPSSKPL